ncbi:hypothetical protein DK058_25165 [Salmonella enterica subsp. enterica serovar Typhi]|nr:hypothetical protein [Salmonella enterica subsp. enterica serovar Typhi]
MEDESGEDFCCAAFEDVTAGLPEEAMPSFHVSDDNILMLTVATLETDEGPAFMDHAVLFCPFCGTQLQDARMIAGKVGH